MSINDPRWGRSGGDSNEPAKDNGDTEEVRPESDQQRDNLRPSRGQNNDLDQLWDDFNKTINSILGTQREENRRQQQAPRPENDGGNEPPRRSNGGGIHIIAPKPSMKTLAAAFGIVALLWAGSGFYIVPEGQIGVVTTFGKYTNDASAGFNWHVPYPIQEAELVDISSVRKAEIGIHGQATRLKEALMLTDDENIVDVMFNVQYRIKPHAAKDFLFRTRNPDQSVFQAAESAMREVVGRKAMDSVLFENKQEIAENVKQAMQDMLDRYQTGIEMMSVAIQNAQPPEQVQAAFNDAVKAGQDRERQINEGEAYANSVIPKARGLASRLRQEAEGYKARVVETATGDAERFDKVLAQYEKAPVVTRDRMYVDTMRDIYTNATKVFVDTKGSNSLLYLPFDKLMSKSAETQGTHAQTAPAVQTPAAPAADPSTDLDPRTLMRLRGR